MSPSSKLKKAILELAIGTVGYFRQEELDKLAKYLPLDTEEKVCDAYDLANDNDWLVDVIYGFRCGQVETGLLPPYSRHYSAKEVATETSDGWVGWTYWSGGGKHGEPEAIEWIMDAYDLDCKEETRVVKVFTRKEQNAQD
jgi:hypothetical protein